MSTSLNESQVLAKTRCQDLYSVYKLNCWGSGIKDVSLVRKLANVEVIGLSCNEISTLEDFAHCPKLKELILRKNKIENIAEIAHLQALPKLTNLWLEDNPCVANTPNYRKIVLKALPNLTVLDNISVTREELQEIEELGNEIYEEISYESTQSHSSGSDPNSGPSSSSSNLISNVTGGPQIDNTVDSGNQCRVLNSDVSLQSLQNNNSQQIYLDANISQTPTNASVHQQYQNQHVDDSESQSINSHNQNISVVNQNVSNKFDESIRDMSINFLPNDDWRQPPMSARLTHRPHSRTSAPQYQHCRSLNGQDLGSTSLNYSQNQASMYTNLSNGNANHINCNNNNNNAKANRAGKSNIVSAILCLIKELDYPSCEVVRTALHIHMEETSE